MGALLSPTRRIIQTLVDIGEKGEGRERRGRRDRSGRRRKRDRGGKERRIESQGERERGRGMYAV